MGDQQQIPLTANYAEGDIAGHETLLNVYPRKSTGGKYPYTLIHTPGQAFFANLPTLPLKGAHVVNERVFAVTSTKLYEVFADGSFNELGTVDIVGIVDIDDNGLQMLIVDGFKGFSLVLETGEVAEVIQEGFYPARTVTEQDGYFILDRKGTDQYFISDLLSINFDPLNFTQAGGATDNLLAVISNHRELFLFGSKAIRVHYNSGAADFPFELNQGAYVEKGCAAPHTAAKQDNTLYFVGSDLMVYQMAGYSPVRVSTHAVEQTLVNVDLSDAFAYTYQDEGHLFYRLTIPAQKLTWCYDISTGVWHRVEDYHFGRHRSVFSISAFNKTLTGDFQSGQIFHLTRDHLTDDGEPIIRQFTLPTINNGREYLSIYSFELDMTTGVGLLSGQGSDPQAMLEVAKNGGEDWGHKRFAPVGKRGRRESRTKWNQLGAARQHDLRVTISDSIPIDIGGAYIEV